MLLSAPSSSRKRSYRWGSEQGRQVITHVFSFLQLHDIPQIRSVCVAWWRASHAREIWISIAESLQNNNRSSLLIPTSATASVFGVRDVEGILKQVVTSMKQEQRRTTNLNNDSSLFSDPRSYFPSHNNINNGVDPFQDDEDQSQTAHLPSWLPPTGQLPSWVPQPPPRRVPSSASSAVPNRNSQQIHFSDISQARQEQREQSAASTTNHFINNNENNHHDSTSSIKTLKQQLDEIALHVLQKLRIASNVPHSSLLPWQRAEIIETQINALRWRAKQLVATSSSSSAIAQNQSSASPGNVDSRVALLEKRQSDSNQLAINTKLENEKTEDRVKYSRRVYKIIELQSAQRRLVSEFERKVVGFCTQFGGELNGKSSSSASSSSSSCALATFFDLEMACLSPVRLGSRLYVNWSAMKRAFPIDDIYFEAVDVILSSNSFANVSALEHVVATDELHCSGDNVESADEELNHLETLCEGYSKRKDFLLLLRKSCIECLKRHESSSSSKSEDSNNIRERGEIRVETHSLIVDTMIAFVYSAKLTLDGTFSEEMKTQGVGTNVNEKGQPLTPVLDKVKNWKEVMDLVDRARNYASAVLSC